MPFYYPTHAPPKARRAAQAAAPSDATPSETGEQAENVRVCLLLYEVGGPAYAPTKALLDADPSNFHPCIRNFIKVFNASLKKHILLPKAETRYVVLTIHDLVEAVHWTNHRLLQQEILDEMAELESAGQTLTRADEAEKSCISRQVQITRQQNRHVRRSWGDMATALRDEIAHLVSAADRKPGGWRGPGGGGGGGEAGKMETFERAVMMWKLLGLALEREWAVGARAEMRLGRYTPFSATKRRTRLGMRCLRCRRKTCRRCLVTSGELEGIEEGVEEEIGEWVEEAINEEMEEWVCVSE